MGNSSSQESTIRRSTATNDSDEPSNGRQSGRQTFSRTQPWSWSIRRSLRARKKKQEISYDLRRTSHRERWGEPQPLPARPISYLTDVFLPEYPQQDNINLTQFQVMEVIAKGAFGNVLKVQHHTQHNYKYAMKMMRKIKIQMDGAVQQCKDEGSIQDFVGHHPFIVKPYWFFQNKDFIFIVMEYIPRGELFTAWRERDFFPEDLVRIYVAELALVLDFLHTSGIIYRDLKMENILIDGDGHLKVIDFGLAKWLQLGQRTKTICGTLQYIAPEILSRQSYGHTSDWWSLGILMYTLLTGKYPLRAADDHIEMGQLVKRHNYSLPPKADFSPEVRDCVGQLLVRDPEERIHDVRVLQNHPFFRNLSFEHLRRKKINPLDYMNNTHMNESFSTGALSRTGSLANSLDDSLFHRGNMTYQWKDSVASLDGLFV